MKHIEKTDYPRNFYRVRAASAYRAARKGDVNKDYHLGRAETWRFVDSSFNATIEVAERLHK